MDNGKMNEAALVARAQAGDEAAFSELVAPYMRLAYHVALRITRNREEAEDASQQSLFKAYTRLHQFNGDSHFSTWLTRIAINEALMKVRKRRSEEAYYFHYTGEDDEAQPIDSVPASEEFQPDELVMKQEKRQFLRKAIFDLRRTSRAVVWLLGIQERKIREASRILNMSESAVKSRYMRARQHLRTALADRVS
jgi:RNA polymerase sigma-70 factor, ECF subfamily